MKKVASLTKRLLTTSMFSALLATSMLATSSHAGNPAPTIKADAPNRYVVKKGDTLWGISGRYLHSPASWKQIWATNKQVKNPNLIYPGDILIMCIIKGKTLVGVDTGEGCAGVEKTISAPTASTESMTPQPVEVRSAANSVPAIPLQTIRHWLDRVIIVNPDDYEDTPYVLASKNRNLITSTGDKIYVKGTPLMVGETYGIYRKGEPYTDPLSKKVIGLETTQVATGIVTDVASNGVSSILLTKSYGKEVREGDKAFIDIGNFLPPIFYPEPAEVNRPGRIVRVMGSISSTGPNGVVAINLGRINGANEGDVLTVYRRGPLVRDIYDNDMPVRLPSEPSGNVMIFKSFENISYAYVLDAEIPLSVGDQLLPPEVL